MNKIKTSLLLSLMVAVLACTPDPLEITIPQAESQIAVLSQVLPDEGLVILLTKSFSALQTPAPLGDTVSGLTVTDEFLQQVIVENAIVTVTGPGYMETLLNVSNGVYIGLDFPFMPGNEYTLNAYNPDTDKSISAKATTLPIVYFDTITAKRMTGINSDKVVFNYRINDLPGDNYYLVNYYRDSIPSSSLFSFGSNKDFGVSIAFSDRSYPENRVEREDIINMLGSDSIQVTLTNISKDYFDFLKARERVGVSFLTEPVVYPSNVEGGLGFFNLHFPSVKVVTIKQ